MTEYLQLIGLTLAGGVVSLIGGFLLLSNKHTARRLADYATPFAAGALLAAVFLDLMRDGLEGENPNNMLYAALAGILIFFLAERFLHWFHHHHQHEEEQTSKALIITGDTMHNALDGVAIASAFLISPATGVVTTLAVAAHEIPQEIGDFGLLLKRGMRRRNVVLVNILSALATTLFAVVTFAVGSANAIPTDALLGLSAGFLLYIALSDIIPDIHDNAPKNKLLDWRAGMLLLGVLVVGIAIQLAHDYIDTGHSHETSCTSYYSKDGEELLFEACEDAEHVDEAHHIDEAHHEDEAHHDDVPHHD